jgi:4-diphosphocytidyl-2-C-methyl-D-erythritol kinase
MRVRAFAKINLSLRVLGTRADGYHELRTIFQSIALHDTITVRAARGPFRLACDDPDCPADDSNLIWRAAERVWRAAGRRGAPRDVAVDLR